MPRLVCWRLRSASHGTLSKRSGHPAGLAGWRPCSRQPILRVRVAQRVLVSRGTHHHLPFPTAPTSDALRSRPLRVWPVPSPAVFLTALNKRLLMLETALKLESFETTWAMRRDEWRAKLQDRPDGHEAMLLREGVAGLDGGIAWVRVLQDEAEYLAKVHPQGMAHAAANGAAGTHANAADGQGGDAMRPTGLPRAGSGTGMGKRPRALSSGGGGSGGANGNRRGADAKRARTVLSVSGEYGMGPNGADGEDWAEQLLEVQLPTRDQLLSAPPTERVPAAALQMLVLLESIGLEGRYEGAVVLQLLELLHRHVNRMLGDALDCWAHRVDAVLAATPKSAAELELQPQDVAMAVQMEMHAAEQAGPPPREVLAASGCCAVNLTPLPLLHDDQLGVVLPGRAERQASLRS
mmetsp:Transcript_23504/g.60446  ORF Transcript_23504/g.60446 Transcript_23504/m.60446 type:complete len:408 (-) Transcript_23504:144-1367(-)